MDAEVKPWGDWWDRVHSFRGIENACRSLYGYRFGVGYAKYVFINECGYENPDVLALRDVVR